MIDEPIIRSRVDIAAGLGLIQASQNDEGLVFCTDLTLEFGERVRGRQSIQPYEWLALFTQLGLLAWDTHVSFEENEFIELLVTKSQAYGDAPLLRWGLAGMLMRIDSKIERYLNLKNTTGEVAGEAARDTLTDIIGYCILGIRMVMIGVEQ